MVNFRDTCFCKTMVGLEACERVGMHVIDVFYTRIFSQLKIFPGFSHFWELISLFVNLKT